MHRAVVRQHSQAPATPPHTAVPLFAGLRDTDIKAIEAAGLRRHFEPSQIIIRADEPARALFLIQSGCVDFYVANEAGTEILLRRLAPGDVFGAASFLSNPIGYMGTAKAVRNVEVLEWRDEVPRRLARTYPLLVENALRSALRYLALYTKRHMRLVAKTAQERLAFALSSLGSRTGHAVPDGVEVDVKNEDLASLADVSFFTASRLLQSWDRNGIVEKSRGRVIIRSPEKLLAA